MIEVGADNFQQAVVEESLRKPVLVDFWAEWCGPCKALGPVLEKLEKKYAGKFLLAKIDTEAHPSLAQQFQISSIPAVKLIDQGKIIDEFVGALPEEQIITFLEKHIVSEDMQTLMALANQGKFSEAMQKIQAENLSGEQVDDIIWQAIVDLLANDLENKTQLETWLKLIANFGSKYSDHKQKLLDFFESEPGEESLQHFSKLFTETTQVEALDYFLLAISNSENKEKAKAELFAAFAILGNTHPLVMNYRKKLASILF